MQSETQKGLLVATIGAIILSFDTLLLRLVGGEPLQMAFWRGLLMCCSGCGAYIAMRLMGKRQIEFPKSRNGIVVSVFYGVASVSFVSSAMLTSVANMLVIVATAPFWAAIASRFILKEPTEPQTLLSCAAAFLGIVIVVWPGLEAGLNVGDLLALAAALSMAAAFVGSRRTRENLALAPAVGGLVSAVVVAPFAGSLSFKSNEAMILMVIEGGLLMPIALGLIAIAPRYLPAPQVGLFLLLETVFGPFWIWVALSEKPAPNALLGGTIVVASLAGHALFHLRNSSGQIPIKPA